MPPKPVPPPPNPQVPTPSTGGPPAPGIAPTGETTGCIHTKDANFRSSIHRPNLSCLVCYGIGYRQAANLFRFTSGVGPEGVTSDYSDADKGSIEENAFKSGFEKGRGDLTAGVSKLLSFPAGFKPSPDLPTKFAFPVMKKEHGEIFHGLFASLLTTIKKGDQDKPLVALDLAGASPSQKMLAENYLTPNQLQPEKKPGPGGKMTDALQRSKDAATTAIAETFSKGTATAEGEMALFEKIRHYIDDNAMLTETEGISSVTPSFHAQIWIDAALRAYEQEQRGKKPAKTKAPPGQRAIVQDVATISLPDPPAESDRVAVIVVRRDAAASAGASDPGGDKRIMDDENIKTCLKAIAAANIAAVGQKAAPWKDKNINLVILFGDIGVGEGSADKFQPLLPVITIVSLSSPFAAESREPSAAVRAIWASFKGGQAGPLAYNDRTPKEVKALAFFLAFRQKYGENLLCIGFRSGTLDGAGFLGIPIFYLDDTKPKPALDGKEAYFDLGAYRRPGSNSPVTTVERITQLTVTMNTFIRVYIPPSSLPLNVPTRLGVQYDLSRLLFVYACCTSTSGKPLWTQRLGLMSAEDPKMGPEILLVLASFVADPTSGKGGGKQGGKQGTK